MQLQEPKFYIALNERNLLIPFKMFNQYSAYDILDLLLDYGFKTSLELSRFDNYDQKLVEFVQTAGDNIEESEYNNQDHYH